MMQEYLELTVYKECQKRSFLPINILKQIGNAEMSPLILGDSAYSFENWLISPYSKGGNLRPDETRLNLALSTSQVVVENAFGRFFVCILCNKINNITIMLVSCLYHR